MRLTPYFARQDDEFIQMADRHGEVETLYISVSGDPRPQQRPVLRRAGVATPYLLNGDAPHLVRFRGALRSVMGVSPRSPPVFGREAFMRLTVVFLVRRAPSHYTSGGRLHHQAPRFPTQSDIDNYAKFVMDGLQGVIIHDDRRIAELCAAKIYANGPRVGKTMVKLEKI